MPLTRPYDLEHHPALSLPYKSKVLNEMVATAGDMLHLERRKLVEIKNMMTTFRGDYNWIPCGDIATGSRQKLTNGLSNGASARNRLEKEIFEIDLEPEDVDNIQIIDGKISLKDNQLEAHESDNLSSVKAEATDPDTSVAKQHADLTRSWPLPEPPSLPPLPMAEESKRLLTAVVQKQTEIVQGVSQLHNNLLRATRLKETVWRWCRAEGHVDEMSDGEDWVDLDQWGLTRTLFPIEVKFLFGKSLFASEILS